MARMIRKQIYIDEAQESQLKARAKAEGRTEAEIIREGIDLVLEKSAAQRRAEARTALFALMDDIAAEVEACGGEPMTWDRDEIHQR